MRDTDAFVLFPDPMGATGGSLSTAVSLYDDRQYIVPGGGGFGEIMNNAYM